MVIANFTPDEFKWMHLGQDGTLKPGDIKEFDEARAKHILSQFGPRGLLILQFGDDPKEKKRKAMEIHDEFWMRQITRFNQDNEGRRMEHRSYVAPTKQLADKAKALGQDLLGPWTNKPTESIELAEMRTTVAKLQQDLNATLAQNAELIALLKSSGADRFKELDTPGQQVALEGKLEDSEAEAEIQQIAEEDIASQDEFAELKHRLKYMNGMQLGQWVMEHPEDIQVEWPKTENGQALVTEIKAKWNKILSDAPWPFPE